MKRIFIVTGGYGHLGYNLVRMLLDRGEEVRIFELAEKSYFADENVSVVKGDIRDRNDVEKVFDGLDGYDIYVVHCAGIVSIASKYDSTVYDVNVTGTKNVADLCLENSVKRMIYVSSVHAIPEGKEGEIITETNIFEPDKVVGLYAKTKSEATRYVLNLCDKGLQASVVQPSGIIGPGDFNIGHTTRMIIDYLNGRLTSGINGGYDFVDVRDVCQGIISCANNGRTGECYILSNTFVSVKLMLDTLHELTGRRRIISYLPMWFIKPLAPLAELYYKIVKTKPLFTAYSLYTLRNNANFSHEKAARELGYSQRLLKETLRDTTDWLVEQGHVKINQGKRKAVAKHVVQKQSFSVLG